MSRLKELLQTREALVTKGLDLDKAMGGTPSVEQRKSMRDIEQELKELDTSIEDEKSTEEARGAIRTASAEGEAARAAARPSIYGDDPRSKREPVTPGELFIRSEAYAAWMNQFPNGAPAMGESRSAPVPLRTMSSILGMQHSTDKMRALITSDDASAGDLVYSLRRGLIEPGLWRPLTVRSLVTTLPVTTDTIEYVREASHTQNAGPVAEATALTGTSGTKPEGGLVFETVTDTVKTIAEWVPITRRILQDAPQLAGYIDDYLTMDLAEELEDQLISGSGSGENFTGILNTSGVLTQGTVANENNFDLIRRAKTKVRLQGRTNPTAILLNPEDSQDMDIAKSGSASAPYNYWGAGPFGAGNGPSFLWGIPVVESEAVAAGTALVGDFSKSILYDREATTITVGTANDDFIRNIVRVLAEMRAGFGVIRPKAFVIVTLG